MELQGKKVVVTGVFAQLERSQVEAQLAARGARVIGSVSKNTDMLFVGTKPGSKLAAAKKLGIPMFSERDLIALLGGKAKPGKTDFLRRLERMLETLESHPDIQVVWSYVAPPASPATIASVEAKYGALDPAITRFYSQCDGFAFLWFAKSNESFDPKKHKRRTSRPKQSDIGGDYHNADGAAFIHPIKDTFVTADWKDRYYFDWMSNDDKQRFAKRDYPLLDFSKSIRIFDSFSMYNMAAFITAADRTNPPVVLGDDHGACWTDSKRTDFDSYIETVLATYGSIEARRRLFLTYEGHKKPPLRLDRAHWKKQNLSLDAVLKKWPREDD